MAAGRGGAGRGAPAATIRSSVSATNIAANAMLALSRLEATSEGIPENGAHMTPTLAKRTRSMSGANQKERKTRRQEAAAAATGGREVQAAQARSAAALACGSRTNKSNKSNTVHAFEWHSIDRPKPDLILPENLSAHAAAAFRVKGAFARVRGSPAARFGGQRASAGETNGSAHGAEFYCSWRQAPPRAALPPQAAAICRNLPGSLPQSAAVCRDWGNRPAAAPRRRARARLVDQRPPQRGGGGARVQDAGGGHFAQPAGAERVEGGLEVVRHFARGRRDAARGLGFRV